MSDEPDSVVVAVSDLHRRRAVIRLADRELADLLDLPEGMHVAAVWADPVRAAIGIGVVSEHLPECDPATEAPDLPEEGAFVRRQMVGEDGKVYVRFGWEPDTPQRTRLGPGIEPCDAVVIESSGNQVRLMVDGDAARLAPRGQLVTLTQRWEEP